MTFEELFPERDEAAGEGRRLGLVTGGSLSRGLEVRLDGPVSTEAVKVGRYVAIQGQPFPRKGAALQRKGEEQRFFGMITDVSLGAIDPHLTLTPPDVEDPFVAEVLAGTGTFGKLQVTLMLALACEQGLALSVADPKEKPVPAKTVPPHFSVVEEASERDMALIFGEDDARHFWVGTPLDMTTKVCLNLKAFVERSNGVFGKSGTGKTFFTRILLACLVQKGGTANLIFDMHDEYGWAGTSEAGHEVKGLKQLFGSKVAVFTLDEESARRRRVPYDHVVEIGYGELEPEDIQALRQTLNLTELGAQACYRLERLYGREWLTRFLALDKEELANLTKDLAEAPATVDALRRRLEQLRRLPFLVEKPKAPTVERLVEYLERGMHVVLEFGRYKDNTLAYVLVANLLTRRLHDHYVRRTEAALGDEAAKPTPLVITIEEAHRFLNPEVGPQTSFGQIAREMRKYNVTLLVIDQRPSGIEEEVLSQLGTKVAFLLDNERDLEAVLSGVAGRSELRGVLSRLESREQALIYGHAVPLPVVVEAREYGTAESYRPFGLRSQPAAGGEEKAPARQRDEGLFG